MPTLVAYGNIQQPFPFEEIPTGLVPEKLQVKIKANLRISQRHQCRRLAHFLLWQLLKISQKETALLGKIARTESGRPYFNDPSLDFNISHSGDWVAVILQVNVLNEAVVGIDIEVPKTRNFEALMTRMASHSEMSWFGKQDNEGDAFYRCWTLREAILKSQGVGIVKLSEVEHYPEKAEIYSAHCPQGQLIFSQEIPFYLSAFSNTFNEKWQCFEWNGETLLPKSLNNTFHYQVNGGA